MFVDVDTASVAVHSEESVGNTIRRTSLARDLCEHMDDHLLDVDWTSHCGIV